MADLNGGIYENNNNLHWHSTIIALVRQLMMKVGVVVIGQ